MPPVGDRGRPFIARKRVYKPKPKGPAPRPAELRNPPRKPVNRTAPPPQADRAEATRSRRPAAPKPAPRPTPVELRNPPRTSVRRKAVKLAPPHPGPDVTARSTFSEPIRVEKLKDGKPTGKYRRFEDSDEFGAYQERKEFKAGRRRAQEDLNRELAAQRSPRNARARKSIERDLNKKSEHETQRLAAWQKIDDDAKREQGQYNPNTRTGRGVLGAAARRVEEREAATKRKLDAKRRGGGVKQLAVNAWDELRDTAASAPQAPIALGNVLGELRPDGRTVGAEVPNRSQSTQKREYTKALVKETKEHDPAYALATGKGTKETLGRAKVRPLTAAGEVTVAGGVVMKALRGGSGASRAVAAGARSPAVVARESAAAVREAGARSKARPQLALEDVPKPRQRGKAARKQVRQTAKAEHRQAKETAGKRSRGEAVQEPLPERARPREYSSLGVARVVQKAGDVAKAATGHDPNVAGRRQHKKARKRAFDADVRNYQAGGIGREEETAALHARARRRMSTRERQAVDLVMNKRIRPEHARSDLQAARRTIANPKNRTAHTEKNLAMLDDLIANAHVFEKDSVKTAGRIQAEKSKGQDMRQSKAGYAEQGRLDWAAAAQGPILRGEIVPNPDYVKPKDRRKGKKGKGRGRVTPPPPSPGSARPDVVDEPTAADYAAIHDTGVAPTPKPKAAAVRGDRLEAELSRLEAHADKLEEARERGEDVQAEWNSTHREINRLENELERMEQFDEGVPEEDLMLTPKAKPKAKARPPVSPERQAQLLKQADGLRAQAAAARAAGGNRAKRNAERLIRQAEDRERQAGVTPQRQMEPAFTTPEQVAGAEKLIAHYQDSIKSVQRMGGPNVERTVKNLHTRIQSLQRRLGQETPEPLPRYVPNRSELPGATSKPISQKELDEARARDAAAPKPKPKPKPKAKPGARRPKPKPKAKPKPQAGPPKRTVEEMRGGDEGKGLIASVVGKGEVPLPDRLADEKGPSAGARKAARAPKKAPSRARRGALQRERDELRASVAAREIELGRMGGTRRDAERRIDANEVEQEQLKATADELADDLSVLSAEIRDATGKRKQQLARQYQAKSKALEAVIERQDELPDELARLHQDFDAASQEADPADSGIESNKLQRERARIEAIDAELAGFGPKHNQPAHQDFIGGDTTDEVMTTKVSRHGGGRQQWEPGRIPAGQKARDVGRPIATPPNPKASLRGAKAAIAAKAAMAPRRTPESAGEAGPGPAEERAPMVAHPRFESPSEQQARATAKATEKADEQMTPEGRARARGDTIVEAKPAPGPGATAPGAKPPPTPKPGKGKRPSKYIFSDDGREATLDELLKAYGSEAGFSRLTKLEHDDDRQLKAPKAGHGYELRDLLGDMTDTERSTDAALQRERQITWAHLAQTVKSQHAASVHREKADAEAAAEQLGGHEVVKMGDEHAVLPSFLAKRLRGQLADDPKRWRAAKWGTRLAIRATLPFSAAWHAGNAADLMTRLALTLPPGSALDGAQAAAALEKHLDQLDPDLRHLVLDSMKGHFGTRRTVRDPKASDFLPAKLGVVSDALGRAVKLTQGPKVVDALFKVSSDIEGKLVKPAIGAHAADYARKLGHDIGDIDTAMKRLAEDLQADPRKVHELQDKILATVGDFATRTPWERKYMAGTDVYWTWLKESTRFVLKTLPAKHPKRTAMLLLAAELTAEERAKAGLNYYWNDEERSVLTGELGYKRQRKGYFQGSIAAGETGETAVPVAGMTSFGEVAANLTDPARLGGRLFSYLQRPAAAAMGHYRTPAEKYAKKLPGVEGEPSDLDFPSRHRMPRAIEMLAEEIVPGVKQARIVQEKGGTPHPGSTVLKPKSYNAKDYAEGVKAVGNPFRAQRVRGKAEGATGDEIQSRTPPKVGEMFSVTDSSGKVFWLRRER